jgi:hypothetical protein
MTVLYVDGPSPVIASAAKQSMAPRKERMDCFVASAPRNDGSRLPRLDPFRRTTPQRVAMLGKEETEMADFGRASILRRHGDDARLRLADANSAFAARA